MDGPKAMNEVAVALLWALKGAPLTLTSAGPLLFQTPSGRPIRLQGPVLLRAEGQGLWAGRHHARSWRVQSQGTWRLQGAGGQHRMGRGPLTLLAHKGGLMVQALMPLEDWVAGVGAAEVDGRWPAAARQALAIAARSSTWAWRGRHRASGFDVCDSTHCMAFRGLEAHDPEALAAAKATQSLVLWGNGRVQPLPWHSTCAGHTANPREVFGGPMFGLQSLGDRQADGQAWCQASPHARPWRCWVGGPDLERALVKANRWAKGWRSPKLGPAELGRSGVALSVPIGEGRAISGYALWQMLGAELGWGQVKSPAFQVRPQGDGAWLEGRGLGHLVGMCQWGAKGRALAGWGSSAILKAYAPGLSLHRL